jgi:endonuclease YncB( thermonuclease family)
MNDVAKRSRTIEKKLRDVKELLPPRASIALVLLMVLATLVPSWASAASGPQPIATIPDAAVLSVSDGDGIAVRVESRRIRIRLEGIDAPELAQPFGPEARAHLVRLVEERRVTLHMTGADQGGRVLARVELGGVDVNLRMVRDGFAWHFTRYSDDTGLAAAEREARAARRGLWSAGDPMAPWEFRQAARASTATSPVRGNTRSRVYHAPDCQHYRCRSCTAEFPSPEVAEQSGYRAHEACVGRRAR